MAGRAKQGIDYAGWSVSMFDNDDKIDLLLDAYGWDGFGIYFYLCQRAFGGDGYFYRWSYASCASTSRKMGGGIGSGTIKEVVGYCLRIGLFDKGLFDRWGILTSKGIQRSFWRVLSARRVKMVYEEFWLLDDEECPGLEKYAANGDSQAANDDLQATNGDSQAANAHKYSTVQYSTVKESTHMPAEAVKRERIPYHEIVKRFNEICSDLPKVTQITDSRKRAISARVKDAGQVEMLFVVFKMVADSDFLSGRSGEWKASFDWIMKPNNFAKIREGNYKNRKGNNAVGSGTNKKLGMWRSDEDNDYAELEKRAQEMLFRDNMQEDRG